MGLLEEFGSALAADLKSSRSLVLTSSELYYDQFEIQQRFEEKQPFLEYPSIPIGKKCFLLTLPTEIRIEIYRHVLGTDKTICFSIVLGRLASDVVWLNTQKASIIFTCKTCFAEAGTVVYSDTTFHIDVRWEPPYTWHRFFPLNSYAHLLRRIVFTLPRKEKCEEGAENTVVALHQLHRLRCRLYVVTVDVCAPSDHVIRGDQEDESWLLREREIVQALGSIDSRHLQMHIEHWEESKYSLHYLHASIKMKKAIGFSTDDNNSGPQASAYQHDLRAIKDFLWEAEAARMEEDVDKTVRAGFWKSVRGLRKVRQLRANPMAFLAQEDKERGITTVRLTSEKLGRVEPGEAWD